MLDQQGKTDKIHDFAALSSLFRELNEFYGTEGGRYNEPPFFEISNVVSRIPQEQIDGLLNTMLKIAEHGKRVVIGYLALNELLTHPESLLTAIDFVMRSDPHSPIFQVFAAIAFLTADDNENFQLEVESRLELLPIYDEVVSYRNQLSIRLQAAIDTKPFELYVIETQTSKIVLSPNKVLLDLLRNYSDLTLEQMFNQLQALVRQDINSRVETNIQFLIRSFSNALNEDYFVAYPNVKEAFLMLFRSQLLLNYSESIRADVEKILLAARAET